MSRALLLLGLVALPAAASARPGDPEVACLRRLAAVVEAEVAGENPDVRRALGPCATLPEARLQLCLSASARGPRALSDTCADDLRDAPTWRAEALLAAGARAWRERDLPLARRHLLAALEVDPALAPARAGLVALAAAGRKPADSKESLAQARALAMQFGTARRLRDLDAHDPLRPAVRALAAAVERLEPACAECQGRLAWLYAVKADAQPGALDQRSWRAAAAALRVVLAAEPGDLDSRLTLSDTLHVLMDYKGAAAVCEEGLRRDPRWAEGAREAGRAWLSAQRPEAALPYLEKAVALEPDEPTGWLRLGQARRLLGRPDAVEALRRAVAGPGATVEARLALAQAELDAGELPAAAARFREATRQAPEAPAAWFGLLRIAQLQGDAAAAAEAQASYQRALEASQAEVRRGELAARLTFSVDAVLDQIERGAVAEAGREAAAVAGANPEHGLLPLARAALALRRGEDPGPFLPGVVRLCVEAQRAEPTRPAGRR